MNSYFEFMNKILENIDEINLTEDLKKTFIQRTREHVKLVNKYASKINKSYPSHDASKFDDLLEGYAFFSKPEEERTQAETDLLDLVTLIHIKNSPHHPEYWTSTNLEGFTRKNCNPHGIIDATQMPKNALEEMCADWSSVSEMRKSNTPMEWFNKVNGVRWLFTPEQQEFIKDTINKMWED